MIEPARFALFARQYEKPSRFLRVGGPAASSKRKECDGHLSARLSLVCSLLVPSHRRSYIGGCPGLDSKYRRD